MNAGLVLRDLVLVGGGHAHVHTLRMFGMKPEPGVRVTLARARPSHATRCSAVAHALRVLCQVTRDVQTPYSGMLPGLVSGAYTHDECHSASSCDALANALRCAPFVASTRSRAAA